MAMNYMEEYQKWLDSGALTEAEHAELLAIREDPKEIESRFYGPLEFGTAGLRGTMKVGLHHMNNYVVRHATQGFANVIAADTIWALPGLPPRSWPATASTCAFLMNCAPPPS